ncbi:MAG: methylated-DNA--[protein]-cysteine S-methyltransferase [Gammaproteobacteria bacterium]|nr:methylated-DNA--[protein]-cysteine S-methyltransferase [Gammaproteobacteria bacterium]
MSSDYERIAAAIRYIDHNVTEQPQLESIAAAAEVSVAHCRRLFRRWAGVGPKRFLEFMTVNYARQALQKSASVLEASLATGLSGPSRLHDHFIKIEAMTPGEVRRGGAGIEIAYGCHDSPFGNMLVAQTARGICGLAFCEHGETAAELERLRGKWPTAVFRNSKSETATIAAEVAELSPSQPISILVSGTNFQVRVWEALLRIPAGTVCSYGQLATLAGAPGSARAIGSAVGANHVAWLIPCHRVIRSTGGFGGYRWGIDRKRAMLGWEAAQVAAM